LQRAEGEQPRTFGRNLRLARVGDQTFSVQFTRSTNGVRAGFDFAIVREGSVILVFGHGDFSDADELATADILGTAVRKIRDRGTANI
jgi:hypothetical protein